MATSVPGTGAAVSDDPPLSNPNPPTEEAKVNRISIRTPPFCKEKPALWFASLDSQFILNSITSELTKFHYAVSQLDITCTQEVEDVILNPPPAKPYTHLKATIIARFSESYEEKVRRLLEKEQIGDRRPSSFLRHLRSLAGASFPEKLLQTMWSNRLPRQVQIVLAAQRQQDLSDLAELADQLMEISANTPEVSAVSPQLPTSSDQLSALQQQVEQLTRTVAALATSRDRSLDRSQSGQRRRSRSRPRNTQLCFYHDRFGKKALKCTHPCTWSAGQDQGNQSSSQ